jgi:chemotaxis family two-component system response regulator Rcp1
MSNSISTGSGRANRLFTILYVEDNPGDVQLLQYAFKNVKMPHQLRFARDGQAAVEFLHRDDIPKPDLILLDLNLPRKTGFEVLEEVKQDQALRRIPIIVLSSSSADKDVERAYALRANCFIQKPSDLNELFSVVRGVEEFWMHTVTLSA